jgi:hypothetical protein
MNTTEKKTKETLKELTWWVNNDLNKRRLSKGIEKINKCLEGGGEEIYSVSFGTINTWYNYLFVYELLKDNTTNAKLEAVASGYHIMVLENEFSLNAPGMDGPMFEEAGLYLANCLSEKWYIESETLLAITNKGLGTPFFDGGQDFRPTAWFIIGMANKGYGIAIDYKKYNYPKSMGVYQEALDNWNTNDLKLLDAIVTKLCDYHLEQASEGDMSDDAGDNDPMFLQFSNINEFVYAFEILTWLSIREMVGLKNPETFTHPLMALELNKLPKVASTMPQNELFDKVMARVRAQNGK